MSSPNIVVSRFDAKLLVMITNKVVTDHTMHSSLAKQPNGVELLAMLLQALDHVQAAIAESERLEPEVKS